MTREVEQKNSLTDTLNISEVIPTGDAIYYAETALENLQEDQEQKKLRDKEKEQLISLALGVLDRHGAGIPVEIKTPYGQTLSTFRRETPIVEFPLEKGSSIGIMLSDEQAAFIYSDNGKLKERTGVKGLHLTFHDLDTGKQIGRKSAGYIGADFAYNAGSNRASINDLVGMRGMIDFIDKKLTPNKQAA